MQPNVGIVILPELPWQQAKRRWQFVESAGFAHAWTYDHLGWRTLLDEPWFDPIPILTAAATATTTIPLGIFVASPNFRHPVPFVRQLLAVDDISAGRLRIGIGAGGGGGYDDSVLGQAPITPGQRVARMAEFAELVDLLLRQPVTDYRGTWFEAHAARSHPGPVQQPRPPLILAANKPRTLAVAARLTTAPGDAWVTTGPTTTDLDAWWRGVAELAERFDELVAATDRSPATVDRHLSLDASPQFALASIETFTEMRGRAGALGFTDVIVHWPRPSGVYAGDEAVLDEVAALLSR